MADQTAQAETVATEHSEAVHHGYDHFYQDPGFWVGTAILTFFALIIWKKIPGIFAKMLDDRSAEIEAQLDNAKTLREEASALLAKYQRDQRDAEKFAADLISKAEAEAKLLEDEAKLHAEEMVTRRSRLAEEKIAQAEANALKEINKTTVEVAIAAAHGLIEAHLQEADSDKLIKDSIDKLDSRLH